MDLSRIFPRFLRVVGLWVGILGCLLLIPLFGLGGGPWNATADRPPDKTERAEAAPLLRVAVAEASDPETIDGRHRVPDALEPRGPGHAPGVFSPAAGDLAAQVVQVASTLLSEARGDTAAPSPLPIPSSLPAPRIDIPVIPDGGGPVPNGWSLKEFVGKAKVKVEKVGPLFAIHLNSDRASFGLHRDITVDVTQYPYLSWAWRVDRLPPKGDARQVETDDQAAQLYLVFPRFPAMVRSQIIGYVWDSSAPVGTIINSPSNRMAKIIVLRSGTDRLGEWVLESRNVLEDFRNLFGDPPPKVGKVSLLINSQHTKSSAESWFAGLVFTRSPLPRESGMSADALPPRAEEASGLGRLARPN